MADAYSYPLLVDIGENKVPRLKIKLIKYFQSKKSNGGDCEVDYENGSETAVLRFRKEEDQQKVLAKEVHEIGLDTGVLRMRVRLPPDETTKQPLNIHVLSTTDAAENEQPEPAASVQIEVKSGDDEAKEDEEDKVCSTMAVIEKLPESIQQEYLEMLVENVLKDSEFQVNSESYTLEIIPSLSCALVTFQSGKVNNDFVMRCPHNKNFIKKGLTAQPLEATKKVLVDDVKNISEDSLCLYFENEGGEVENVELKEAEQSAIITFSDPKVVKILKKEHRIGQEEIRVYPFYESLGIALYGEDMPLLKLPPAVTEPIDEALWRYLSDHQPAVETIQKCLAEHFCSVSLGRSAVCLSPIPSLLQEKDARDIVTKWKDTVKSALAQDLSHFQYLKLQPEPTKWEESEEKIRATLLKEDVTVVSDKASGVISVVGLMTDINRLEQTLREVINMIIKRVQRERFSVTQKIRVAPSIYHILCQDGLEDKLLSVYPELKMTFRKESAELVVSGLNDEILTASKVVCEASVALKRQNLQIDQPVLDFLKQEEPEKLTDTLLTSNKINAAFEITANQVQLLAVTDRGLTEAEGHLKNLLVSLNIQAEDSNVLKKPGWKDLVSRLENANNKPLRTVRVHTTDKEIVVSGYKDRVERVCAELKVFSTQYAEVEETVPIKRNAIVDYIEKADASWLGKVGDKVRVQYKKGGICLSGCRIHVTECKTLVNKHVSSLVYELFKVSKSGAKSFFQDKEAMYMSVIFSDTGCLAQLADETSDEQDDLRQFPTPVYLLQTPDGVEIAVCKGDMCSYPVDAIVNSSNQSLKLDGGLSAALLKAAGPQLQVECDKLIQSDGQLKPGDSVITNAGGQLSCKKIIHAVGPTFDSVNPSKARAQLRKAIKGSLELAEKYRCVSVAIPTISRNQGFPPNLCAEIIITAVKEYCDEKYDEITLRRIHFVNNDDHPVQLMESAAKQVFGSNGVSQSQQTTSTTPPIPVKPAHFDPNCLFQVQTKEVVDISVLKGNIENSTTDVIVNTVSKDLDLTKGAVSNAILRVAGRNLQQLVWENNQSANIGDVIATAGCNLKCKEVFHAVAPNWDNGKGSPDKILKGIFCECLGKAEDNSHTSISLPAIGTGILGFPKDHVALSLLKEISEFSSKKKPKHLKKVVIVLYPGDSPTIQAFTDEFKKQFPNATGGDGSSSAPQRAGPFSKVVSGSGIHETTMGNVAVQVVTGDITKESSEVIVNSSNNDFSLKTGVSKAILEAAGPTVQAECKILCNQPHQGMILTQPGNMSCKKILHVIGQADPVQINMVVKKALQLCQQNQFTSVSIPAIGTGQGNVHPRQVADAMLDAVIDVLSQNTSTTLKTIRIVIFQSPMLKDFFSSMQEREATQAATEAPKDKGWSFKNIKSKITSLFANNNDDPQKAEDFVIDPLLVDPACFHICSDSQAKVDSAKKWISDLITKEYITDDILDTGILNLSDADRQQIADIQKTEKVSIRIQSKNNQASITIEGLSSNVYKASKMINEMLKKTREEEDLKNKVALAGELADWQYQQAGLQFQSFDLMSNFELEQALKKNQPSVKVTVKGEDYTVTMPSGPATDSKGQTFEIKRIDKLKVEDIPDFWDPMPADKSCLAVTLQPGTPEHKEILSLFQASCKLTVIKIQRIQNPVLWKSLQIKKRDMEQRNKHQNNEKRLFHGTSEDTVDHINEHGFNRSYAGKNAAFYGNGTYFAVNASYSASDTYSKPNQNMEKFMYLCQVLTGDYEHGKQHMIVPPNKKGSLVEKYDSVVDDVTKPALFVIFHDAQAYPEYLIMFK
ncbi:protein mono-ADP-ribosyltransferase PARP14-like isoform X3 [Xyrichtys novacula]|uniref:Poly [ADP-ribose] polymerase n=1 Tax=Xyrichtys novacula TaxID=13765 RepID=A0AAV1H3H7_XYRNO|nr:protein mono-ADP-ribosyltransferase PARP14-like isoform X3 [Xyrichtys novacula]